MLATPVTAKEPTAGFTFVGSTNELFVVSSVPGAAISTERREPKLVIAVEFVAPVYTAAVSTGTFERSSNLAFAASAALLVVSRVAAVGASVRFRLIFFFVEVASAVNVLYSVTISSFLDEMVAFTVTFTGIALSASVSTDALITSMLLDATVNCPTPVPELSAIGFT